MVLHKMLTVARETQSTAQLPNKALTRTRYPYVCFLTYPNCACYLCAFNDGIFLPGLVQVRRSIQVERRPAASALTVTMAQGRLRQRLGSQSQHFIHSAGAWSEALELHRLGGLSHRSISKNILYNGIWLATCIQRPPGWAPCERNAESV